MAKSRKVIIEQDDGNVDVVVRELNVEEAAEVVKFLAEHASELDNFQPAQFGELLKRFGGTVQGIVAEHSVQCPIPFNKLDFSDAMQIYGTWAEVNARFLGVLQERIQMAQQMLAISATASDATV